MKKILVVLVILIIAAAIASCTMIGLMLEEDSEKFVGRWEDEWETVFIFDKNGSCDISESPIGLSWSIDTDDQTLKIWSILWIFSIDANYDFLDDDTISYTITDLSTLAREWYYRGETNILYRGSYDSSY